MVIKKNDVFQVKIEDISSDGSGVGKVDGFPFFVKDSLIGDLAEVKVIKMKKSYGFARLMKIIQPSPDRIEPKCPIARQCGGCQIQALFYEKQLEFKQKKVANNLKRIGGFEDIEVQPVLGMDEPYFYRNKAQFPIGKDREGNLTAGFYAGRTHNIIPVEDCCIGAKVNKEVLDTILNHMNQYHIEPYDEKIRKGLVRHVLIRCGFTTREVMVCVVINGDNLPKYEKLVDNLQVIDGMTSISVNVNKENTNVILGKEIKLLWGQAYITDYIGDVKYQISPLSFYQVNPEQTKVLYGKALEYAKLTGNETVWDLYCGIGTISLFLAQKAKQVYGVEIVPEAIRDAKQNAKINDISNVEFFVGKAEEVLPEKYEQEKIKAEVIVVDPPRKGCDETLLDTIAQMEPERVVYVSCDSATLARDLKYLAGKGYQVQMVQPVDMFPHSVHCEVVCWLEREE